MNKPKVGDIIRISDPEELGLEPYADAARVIAVFDSLDENWDPWGESAWSQRDIEENMQITGEWYVICESVIVMPDGTQVTEPGTFSLGNYEVASC